MSPRSYLRIIATLTATFAFLLPASVIQAKSPEYTRPKKAKKQDPDFALQGEYTGELDVDGGMKVGIQVIAMGKGKFAARSYHGGLPGDGWDRQEGEFIEASKKDDGSVTFEAEQADAVLKDGEIAIVYDGSEIGTLEKVNRKSETLGKKPPAGAIVLFDGKNVDNWENAVMDGKTMAFGPKGTKSKRKFGDHTLHIEFRLPYMPEARGQGRGNSGIYLQSRYEVQMLDSFGLEGQDNECGGIYKISKPKQNMCYPPLTWQTYDIDFTAGKYDKDGKEISKPMMTVKHNGVVIHKDLKLPKPTTASPIKTAGPDNGPVYLQDHGNPVRYRNIWVIDKSETQI